MHLEGLEHSPKEHLRACDVRLPNQGHTPMENLPSDQDKKNRGTKFASRNQGACMHAMKNTILNLKEMYKLIFYDRSIWQD
jgi:hypothetical protein